MFTRVFCLTAQNAGGSIDGLKKRLDHVLEWPISKYTAVSHSDIFREKYHPHYRVVHPKYIDWFSVLLKVAEVLRKKMRILSFPLMEIFGCNVFHIDDYYIPIEKSSSTWREVPAGNIELTRFKEEVLVPLRKGMNVSYRPFLCQKQNYADGTIVEPTKLTIIEGSYSQHPEFTDFYDLKMFFSCDEETQKGRSIEREGDYYEVFESTWIPMENLYHKTCHIKEMADFVVMQE